MRTSIGWLALAVTAVLGWIADCDAFYLDKGRNFDVRVRAYSQLGIMTENSARQGCGLVKGADGKTLFRDDPRRCPPEFSAGDLGQNRNFYNPEFDAKLTDFMGWSNNVSWLKWAAPDDLKFRFAWWGFYDGLYDYLNPVWAETMRDPTLQFRRTAPPSRNQADMLFGTTRFSQTDNISRSYTFTDQNKNPRKVYASQNRINELYIDYTKGPVFLRIGRQAISWGEADTIALLDVSNPFDLTLGAPGFFQDVDEARIPLYTIRSTVKLVDNWKWLSSGFVDAYLVPGPIDTTVPINPIAYGVSPFNPDQSNPQANLFIGPTARQTAPFGAQGVFGPQSNFLHTAVVDHLPEKNWGNSRWGVRLQGLVARDYTLQAWFFRTFNQAPVPLLSSTPAIGLIGPAQSRRPTRRRRWSTIAASARRPASTTTGTASASGTRRRLQCRDRRAHAGGSPVLVEGPGRHVAQSSPRVRHRPGGHLVQQPAERHHPRGGRVFQRRARLHPGTEHQRARPDPGLASEGLRLQGEHPEHHSEGRFPARGDRATTASSSSAPSTRATASFSPWRTTARSTSARGRGRTSGNRSTKPGKLQGQSIANGLSPACTGRAARNNPLCATAVPKNFVDLYQYEGFLQTAIQTDMLHGKLSPRIVIITDISGIFAFQPSFTYRVSDNFILGATYSAIATNRKTGPGVFRVARHGAAARDRAAELSGTAGAPPSPHGCPAAVARSSGAVAGVEVEGEPHVVDGEGEGGRHQPARDRRERA